jgi:hypothetical protein
MTNERQIGQVMIEQVLSGRNGSAPQANARVPAVQATARAARQTLARTVQRTMSIELVSEVPA